MSGDGHHVLIACKSWRHSGSDTNHTISGTISFSGDCGNLIRSAASGFSTYRCCWPNSSIPIRRSVFMRRSGGFAVCFQNTRRVQVKADRKSRKTTVEKNT